MVALGSAKVRGIYIFYDSVILEDLNSGWKSSQ